MTELIIALDGPDDYLNLAARLWWKGFRWFKLGPQSLANPRAFRQTIKAISYFKTPHNKVNIFLDLKLHDTNHTVTEATRRFADLGIAAISTYTNRATKTAAKAAKGTELKVWQWVWNTDNCEKPLLEFSHNEHAHGYIGPYIAIQYIQAPCLDNYSIIVPGVRLITGPTDHPMTTYAEDIAGVTNIFAVVGRPIWAATDPIAAAKKYREVLS